MLLLCPLINYDSDLWFFFFFRKIFFYGLSSYHSIPPNFMYGCIGIKKNNSVASSKIWMNVCLQWWWAEHGGIKLVPFVIHNLWVDPAAASCLSRWYPKLIMVHEKRWIELKKNSCNVVWYKCITYQESLNTDQTTA